MPRRTNAARWPLRRSRSTTREQGSQPAGFRPGDAKGILAVIRALEQILQNLHQSNVYQITRLTRLKRLCVQSVAATQFAAFIAQQSLQRPLERPRPVSVAPEAWTHYVTLAVGCLDRSQHYLVARTPEVQTAPRAQLVLLRQTQNTYQNIPYGVLRIVACWEAMLIETTVRCILTPHDSARLGYELARDYVQRYDSRYGTSLVPASANALEEIISFWRVYAARWQPHGRAQTTQAEGGA